MKCDRCGDIAYGLMDGYAFGDKLLEGVMFRVIWNKKDIAVDVDFDSASYFSGLNQKKWLDAAREHAKQEDMLTCPICGDDIDGPGATR